MSGKIDERIVELKFNTKQFEEGVKDTTQNLADLEKSLQMEGVASAVDNISSKFSAFGAIAFTALQTLTNAAIGFGQKIAGAILDPLIEGGRKRALNIEQAKFQFKGLGMDVEQSMADALYAVQGTAFGLDEAAVAASQFGASGVKSGAEMQNALRGISGVAAMAGSSYTDMANVFTKVAGQGRLMGDDLNRLGTRGINAAATLAEYFNKTGKAVNATEADIRSMVTKGEIDFKTFALAMSEAFGEHATAANETYTGSLSNMRAALSRIGAMYFTPQLERMRTIFNALTPLIDGVAKAITPLMDGFNDLANKGAANLVKMLESLVAPMGTLTIAFQNFTSFLGKVFTPIKKAFQEVFGGSQVNLIQLLIEKFYWFTTSLDVTSSAASRIQTVFKALFSAIKFVLNILVAVGKIIWSVFSSAVKVVMSFLGVFAPLIDVFTKLNKGTKSSEQNIGSLADRFSDFMNRVIKPIIGFFDKLRDAIQGVVDTKLGKWAQTSQDSLAPLEWIAEKITSLFSGIKALLTGVWNVISPLAKSVGNVIKNVADAFRDLGGGIDFSLIFSAANTGILFWFANAIKNIFSGGFEEISKITGIFGKIGDIFDEVTGVLSAMQTKLKAEALMKIALAIGILAAAMFLLGSIDPENIGGAVIGMATIVGAMVGAMAALDKLVMMSGAAKLPLLAASMIAMAAAILILAVAMKVLATMSWDEIARGLVALGGALLIMAGAMLLLSFVGPRAALASVGLVVMAAAILILAVALKIMSTMSWDDIGRGLTVLAGTLLLMVVAMLALGAVAPQAIIASIALTLVAAAILVLAIALKLMATMSWDDIGRGLVVLAGGLALMVAALLLLGAAAPLVAVAAISLILMSVALAVLVGAIYALGSMDMATLQQGLIALAVALGLLVAAVLLLGLAGPLAILGAAAILIMAAALLVLTVAITALGLLPAEAIAQAIGTIAAALGILVGFGLIFGLLAPIFMAGGIALMVISVALLVMAAAMAIFSLALGIFAANAPAAAEGLTMLVNALTELGWGIAILAAAGLALLAFGAGALVAGIGISVLAIGLALLAGALALIGITAPMGASGLMILTAALVAIAPQALKLAAAAAALLAVGVALIILGAGALIAGAGLMMFATGLRMMIPVADRGVEALKKVVEAIAGMVWQLPQLGMMAGGFLALGAALMLLGAGAILAGTGSMLLAAGLMMLNLAATMGSMAMERVNKAVQKLGPAVPTLAMIAAAITMLSASFAVAGAGGMAAAAGITAMILATNLGTASVILFATTISSAIPTSIMAFAMLGPASAKAAQSVTQSFMQIQNGIKSSVPGTNAAIVALVASMTITLISRMNAQAGSMRASGANAGRQLSAGMAVGINEGRSGVVNAAVNVASAAIRALNAELAIRSPSRKAAKSGFYFDAGFAGGISDNGRMVENASAGLADSALTTLQKAMSGVSDFLFDNVDANPTIKPVLDLSSVKKDAGILSNLFSNESLPVRTSYETASSISADHNRALEEGTIGSAGSTVENIQNVTFNQSINSPKAINAPEVYRNTKNQISVAKEKLKSNDLVS